MAIRHDGKVNSATLLTKNINKCLSEHYTESEQQVLFLGSVRHPFVLSLMANTNLAIVSLNQVANNDITLNLGWIIRASASFTHLLTSDCVVIVWLLRLTFLTFCHNRVEVKWELLRLILICHLILNNSSTTSRAEAVAISLTFIIIKNLGITRITIRTHREQMRFGYVV